MFAWAVVLAAVLAVALLGLAPRYLLARDWWADPVVREWRRERKALSRPDRYRLDHATATGTAVVNPLLAALAVREGELIHRYHQVVTARLTWFFSGFGVLLAACAVASAIEHVWASAVLFFWTGVYALVQPRLGRRRAARALRSMEVNRRLLVGG